MDQTRTRPLVLAGVALVGLPLTITLWANVFDRLGNPASAHVARGEKALAAGQYVEAITAFGHAREMRPQDGDIQKDLMKARAYLVAEQPMRITAETLEELRYESTYLLDADRPHAAVYETVLGNVAQRSGNAEEARARFDQALKADPTSVIAHSANAVFLLAQKDGAEKARSEFDTVLKAKPDHVVALVGLAQLALADNKPDVAVEKLEAALKVGDDLTARMLLGNARLRQQKNEEAVPQFLRATQLDPRNAEAWKNLGQAQLATGKAEDAERSLRVAAQLQQDAQTVVALGFALERQKKPDQALNFFAQALQANSNDPTAIFGAGTALEDLGKKTDALTFYKKLLGLQAAPGAPGSQLVAQLQQQAQQRVSAIEGKPPAPPAMMQAGMMPGLPMPGALPPR